MGFWSSAAKVVFFPIYFPYKVGKKVLKKEEQNPIFAVVNTRNPEAYQYYFSGLNLKSDVFDNTVVIWREGISEKERKQVLTKLQTKLSGVI